MTELDGCAPYRTATDELYLLMGSEGEARVLNPGVGQTKVASFRDHVPCLGWV